MKWYPLFILMFFMSCEEKVPNYKKKKVQEEQSVQATTPARSKIMVHMDPRVKIDTERSEILITGQSGDLCGIGFKEGQVLSYQLINDDELEIQLENETLKLNRIHHFEVNGIYGDWQSRLFDSENPDRTRIVTFIIRDHEAMAVDVYCEEETSKLSSENQSELSP